MTKNLENSISALDYLEYRCFAYNRAKYPEIELERYSKIFDKWEFFEKIYQQEKYKWTSFIKKP